MGKNQIRVAWQAPSNIALVKYWGKHPGQIPANASLSFSLDECTTKTTIEAEKVPFSDFPRLQFFFEGKEKPEFLPKIENFFRAVFPEMPWLKSYALRISSENTFPHSSGIASSASAFAALALCITELEEKVLDIKHGGFFRIASHRARLGSGSAARSVYGGISVWGKHPMTVGSSQSFAVPVTDEIHEVFRGITDTILLIDRETKSVSSTAGHALMVGHPYAEMRFKRAAENLAELQTILRSGEVDDFFSLIEEEALGLHALMMSSQPNYILMRPNTVAAIERIRNTRKEENLAVGFTLDAGANVHVIALSADEQKVKSFVESELKPLCPDGLYICDRIGEGPKPF
ncbi:MAG: diphosphomevalonate decarboxylase [Cryomorphaceae bacterium]|nr:diphosphomevalonate decarboxylase [Cryomorphaceae bacterium]